MYIIRKLHLLLLKDHTTLVQSAANIFLGNSRINMVKGYTDF